jgi:hypothetical protein
MLPATAAVIAVTLDSKFDIEESWTAASMDHVAFTWPTIVTLMGLFHTLRSRQPRRVRYQLFVRHTLLGTLLDGKRTRLVAAGGPQTSSHHSEATT